MAGSYTCSATYSTQGDLTGGEVTSEAAVIAVAGTHVLYITNQGSKVQVLKF